MKFIVSVSRAVNKKETRQKDSSELGILDRVIFFDAILREPYWDGCRESHKECVRPGEK